MLIADCHTPLPLSPHNKEGKKKKKRQDKDPKVFFYIFHFLHYTTFPWYAACSHSQPIYIQYFTASTGSKKYNELCGMWSFSNVITHNDTILLLGLFPSIFNLFIQIRQLARQCSSC